MNGNCYYSEGINPTLTTNKGEGNKIAVAVEDLETNRGFNQRNVVHDVNGISRTLIGQGHCGNEPKVAIPVLTPDRAQKKQNGRRFKEDGEESFTLTAQDRHGVAIEVKPKMVGYNATLKQGGGHDSDSVDSECEGLQGIVWRNTDDNSCGDVFAIDKGYKPEERDIANCIESREDRGLSRRKQEGTLICHKIN